jgi:UDP:flavonoid glycosyltransferase YjiC (YdhE family)
MNRIVLRDVNRHWRTIRATLDLPPSTGSPFATISPALHLQNGVAAFEYPRSDLPPQVRFVGSLADIPATTFEPPPWWPEVTSGSRPVVHVTQGTVANDDVHALLTRTIRVLADEDVLVVATTGGPDVDVLGPLPANARAATFLPHGELLPHTAAMVTNGGFGGVQVALSHGVPLVVAGETEDKPEVAARVAWNGAGVRLRRASPRDGDLRAAVLRVLREPGFRARAGRLRDAYARVDTRTEVVNLVGAVLDARRSAGR